MNEKLELIRRTADLLRRHEDGVAIVALTDPDLGDVDDLAITAKQLREILTAVAQPTLIIEANPSSADDIAKLVDAGVPMPIFPVPSTIEWLSAEPPIPTANCCICGRIIDTREQSEGGDAHGDETAPGKWTCSVSCYETFTGSIADAPAATMADTVSIDIKTVEIINGAFLPSNPRRMRNAHSDVIKAAEDFKRALAVAIAANGGAE